VSATPSVPVSLASTSSAAPAAAPAAVAHTLTPAQAAAAQRRAERMAAIRKLFPVSAKVVRYCEQLLEKYDTNHDGILQADEWAAMHGNPAAIDLDRDGNIAVEDLALHVARYGYTKRMKVSSPSPRIASMIADAMSSTFDPAAPDPQALDEFGELNGEEETDPLAPRSALDKSVSRTSRYNQRFHIPPSRLQGLPDWFVARDSDGDGQLTLSEFAPNASPTDILEFNRLDTDRDGVLTMREVQRSGRSTSSTGAAKGLATPGSSKAPR